MNDIKFPLAASVMGHAIGVVLLMLLVNNAPRLPEPIAKGGVQVMFEPALPKDETAPPPMPAVAPETPPPPTEPPPPEPQAETVPPPPEPPVTTTEPTPPAPKAPVAATELPPPPQPPKPAVKKPPKPVPRHQEMPRPTEVYTPPVAPQLPAAHAPSASPQTAFAPTPVPAPAPAPQASAGYRALLSAWLENHKRYPDAARQRGEEGRAVLRFEVDRNGRVLDYTVASSSGYPDLDQSIEEMMRGATLPPFPADMPQPRMEVSVTIRFSLRR